MTQADQYHRQGFLSEIDISGEVILVGNNPVVATVNKQPRFLEMLESGYLDKEPIEFEVLKGYAGSIETVWIDGNSVPQDLRGVDPQLLKQVTYKNVVRKIMKRMDAGDRWILMTIRDNVAGLGRP